MALRWPQPTRIPGWPARYGDGLSGGATAVDGGIVLSTERCATSPSTRSRAPPSSSLGLLNAEVKRPSPTTDSLVPADPSSFEI